MDKLCKGCSNLGEDHPAFCPNCGKRLIDNQWIGHPIDTLISMKESVLEGMQYHGRYIREMESRHKKELAPLQEEMAAFQEKFKGIEEALSHARKHEIKPN